MSKRIGCLWAKKSKDGKVFMSGVLQDIRGDIQIAVFRNDKKVAGSNQPDYNIVLSGEKPKQKVAEALLDSSEEIPF